MNTIGQNIKRARTELGWSQQTLADRVPMSQPALHKLEQTGRTTKLVEVARAIGITVDELQSGQFSLEKSALPRRQNREHMTSEDVLEGLDDAGRAVIQALAAEMKAALAGGGSTNGFVAGVRALVAGMKQK
ncbi:helix-turn-helix transcriptional regulator [Chitinimonas arctica]|uniref:Helix-turn-helix transcriptional regulator n=1 Tax=Chitinimonas arctica TaxID=2594795 RepID=A0A516SEZ0_9NEIS|nr:helix-turn-helix transcriptional regulator [Chitinimonas arctica]QDQ26721.1 helix-turn-helix transcriptional regulator [Chitinimonas arctica]